MDVTWGAIGKVLLAGLVTYIFLPAVLIARDYVLWRVISVYILNDDLKRKVTQYVQLAHKWNNEYAGQSKIEFDDDKTRYLINGQEVSQEDWHQHFEESGQVGQQLRDLKLEIDRKARFFKWLLKHYGQEAIDPINEWKKVEMKRLEKRDNASS
ncbi:hypothetical protein P8S55_03365 [Halomonas sp. M1]|uniref:hypothetical protein n=1 Tax=Halomonas sp. M1 TaxID=3035470 RepID=UPI0024857209|nr:hypothetical protein [Halomonas sp. M1]WFE72135.1 hypothetical protein P8S55_03365 [Halomonas sp. M1]